MTQATAHVVTEAANATVQEVMATREEATTGHRNEKQ